MFALASIAATGTIGYFSFSAANDAYKAALEKSRFEGHVEGRSSILNQLVKFGPARLRRMCLEVGIRFPEPAEEGDWDEDRAENRQIYEGLVKEVRYELREELKRSMKKEVEEEVKGELLAESRREIRGDAALIARLYEEAKNKVREELKREVIAEVRGEMKREIRAELSSSGRDVDIIAEAISDLREETRASTRSKLRMEAKRELRSNGRSSLLGSREDGSEMEITDEVSIARTIRR